MTETVTGNPVPAALIGAGLAWLLLEGRVASGRAALSRRIEQSDMLDRARDTFDDVSERVSGAVGSFKESAAETLAGAAESLRERTARVGEYTAEGARAAGSTLRQGVAALGDGARRGYEYSREGASRTWQQHPLMTGLAALTMGVAVGMLLPGTRRENDIMGRQSDALSRRARTAGGALVERGRNVVTSAAEALKQEAEGEGFGPKEVVRKVRRIADHVQEATRVAARRERLDAASVLSDAREAAEEATSSTPAGGANGTRTRSRKR